LAQFVSDRRGPGSRSVVRLALGLALAAVMLLGLGRLQDLLPSLSNPFSTQTVDRSAPAVLHALEDVSQFRAATGNYSVIVDVEEDTRFVPSFIKGERTVFMATGSVDASVDFAGLNERAITVTGDAVTVRLPAAHLGDAVVDPAGSRVVSRNRGALDRLGSVFSDSPTGERELYLLAMGKLDAAAAADTSLVDRAQDNTRRMLEGLLEPLGFDRVEVVFTD
jgi:hypothetical protein